jgi:glycosyltransferase involved in cell wall biosynthesis
MADPLVSILIPAYNERFFGEAFASARAQEGVALEIVVCDDSPGDSIGATVAAANDARVRYVRNPQRLGFGANFTQCFTLARASW